MKPVDATPSFRQNKPRRAWQPDKKTLRFSVLWGEIPSAHQCRAARRRAEIQRVFCFPASGRASAKLTGHVWAAPIYGWRLTDNPGATALRRDRENQQNNRHQRLAHDMGAGQS